MTDKEKVLENINKILKNFNSRPTSSCRNLWRKSDTPPLPMPPSRAFASRRNWKSSLRTYAMDATIWGKSSCPTRQKSLATMPSRVATRRFPNFPKRWSTLAKEHFSACTPETCRACIFRPIWKPSARKLSAMIQEETSMRESSFHRRWGISARGLSSSAHAPLTTRAW